MRIITSKYFLFTIMLVTISVIIGSVWIISVLPSYSVREQVYGLISIVIILSFPLLIIIFNKQLISIVTINEDGVKASVFFIPTARIKWDDIAEVGIGTHNDMVMAYAWIYFSRFPLSDYEITHMQVIKGNNDGIKVRFSKKALAMVQKYYHEDIKNFPDN